MSFDYASMAATATRLLTNFGMAVGLRRVTGASYDPVAGSASGGSTADLPAIGLFVAITLAYSAGFEIIVGDRIAIVDAANMPSVSDRLVVGSAVYSIVSVQEIKPANVAIAYRLQVRL